MSSKFAKSGANISCSYSARELRSAGRDGSALAVSGVLTDVDLGKFVAQYLKRNEQLKHQWRLDVGVPAVDKVVRFWLWWPCWNKFPVLHKVVPFMLVSSTSGCYRTNFVEDNFRATSCNVVVGGVTAVPSFLGHRVVFSSCLLGYGKITGCKETMSKFTRLDDPLMTSPWECFPVLSRGAFVAQYIAVSHHRLPGVVYPRNDEYSSKFLPDLSDKQSKQSGEPRSPLSFPAKKVAKRKCRFAGLILWQARQWRMIRNLKAVYCWLLGAAAKTRWLESGGSKNVSPWPVTSENYELVICGSNY